MNESGAITLVASTRTFAAVAMNTTFSGCKVPGPVNQIAQTGTPASAWRQGHAHGVSCLPGVIWVRQIGIAVFNTLPGSLLIRLRTVSWVRMSFLILHFIGSSLSGAGRQGCLDGRDGNSKAGTSGRYAAICPEF
jgi:hypothetical protein